MSGKGRSFHYMVTYARELTKINDAGWTIDKLSLPRLDTKWGQQGGYNKYCLGSPAGCDPIAEHRYWLTSTTLSLS